MPSRRPSTPAEAPLEVASAGKPSPARIRAEPASHALAMTKNPGAWCNARNRSAFSCWLDVISGLLANRVVRLGGQGDAAGAGAVPGRLGAVAGTGVCIISGPKPGTYTPWAGGGAAAGGADAWGQPISARAAPIRSTEAISLGMGSSPLFT